MRDLGHAKLCGVLFVAYQARSGGIGGDFMLCALFNSYMLLASSEPGYKRFIIDAIIGLDTLRLDSACNGGKLITTYERNLLHADVFQVSSATRLLTHGR